ncbi:NAD(P)-dependent oxidoreductase [Desulfonatronospira sp.]|uniref:NAD-dependent epimerase/dehydratase family protein n=1 Tax=Desulfonatronospira sp. TaxID=1962951 RepID=UPI0025BA8B7F|nr:NAD(P)-dependent oxidoreductase [Desulfonatronospira sp.]
MNRENLVVKKSLETTPKADSSNSNCWDVMQCGRGPGQGLDEENLCPAAGENRLDGVHGGRQAGRACWVVAGTCSGGSVQGQYAQTITKCRHCMFYQQVLSEEKDSFLDTVNLFQKLMEAGRITGRIKRLGLIVGGSGFIGGTLMHYFKSRYGDSFEILAPNSKRLSLRVPGDISSYLSTYRPDFIINCAIPPLDGGAQLAYEVNYLGSINLARAAMALRVPFIHFSSAALQPMGENVTEDEQLPLSTSLPFYPRSKLMADITLRHLHETRGLDCTIIRLGVVYGKHDHKIQGFQRLLFSIATQSMMFLLTRPGIRHSYTHTEKIGPFVHHILENRAEYTGRTFHFVDPEPVELSRLVLEVKKALGLKKPRELYVPYPFARLGRSSLKLFLRMLRPLGFDGRLPQELMFLDKFYKSQILSVERLRNSSFGIPDPEVTIFSELPDIVKYYVARWQHYNLIPIVDKELLQTAPGTRTFQNDPEALLENMHSNTDNYLADFDSLRD